MSADVPKVIRAQPSSSDLLVVDARVQLGPLIRTLAEGGFTVINDRTGKLVVTCWPEDFRATTGELAVPADATAWRQSKLK